MGKLTLILGGARSGKSTYAEKLAGRCTGRVTYIATAQALDAEMVKRIEAHQAKRSGAWQTMEIPSGVGRALAENPPQADLIVLDCLTLLISNLAMLGAPDVDAPEEPAVAALVQAEIEQLLTAIQRGPADWVIVSNEVGLGLVPPYPLGRIYRDWLGWANQQLARIADPVIFMVAGRGMRLEAIED
jgi:adenosylcobinamide kinase/adenosylcobinamide-phosphate guanylyltransferase